ncbi:MAG TPA: RNA-binding protein [Gammaproteobacteria bacterium]|nr:RNA-binding protein [Gammaproteobacteria bacterium]
MNIYVGNLPYSVTEDDLTQMFAQYGEVSSANIIKDKFSGESKGFGFVEMPTQAEAEEAIKGLDGTASQGRTIKVNQARAKTDRPQSRSRY